MSAVFCTIKIKLWNMEYGLNSGRCYVYRSNQRFFFSRRQICRYHASQSNQDLSVIGQFAGQVIIEQFAQTIKGHQQNIDHIRSGHHFTRSDHIQRIFCAMRQFLYLV